MPHQAKLRVVTSHHKRHLNPMLADALPAPQSQASHKPRHKFTREINRELIKRPRPGGFRVFKSIQTFQRALLKVVTEPQQELVGTEIVERKAKASEIASCASAWDKLEERRRILAGIGAPKPVAAVNDKSSAKPVNVTPTVETHLTLDAPTVT